MKRKKDSIGFLSSLFAIVVGLLVGFLILLASNPSEAGAGFWTIITGPLTHGSKGVGQVFYYATPIILTDKVTVEIVIMSFIVNHPFKNKSGTAPHNKQIQAYRVEQRRNDNILRGIKRKNI